MSVSFKFAIRDRRAGRYWSERGISVDLDDADIKLYRHKGTAHAAARIVGQQNAKVNAAHSTNLPEVYDVVRIKQTLEVMPA